MLVKEVMRLAYPLQTHSWATDAELNEYVARLQQDVTQHVPAARTIPELCAAVWTSAEDLQEQTFYGTVQQLLRGDSQNIRKVVEYTRKLNHFLVKRDSYLEEMEFPLVVYRASWLPTTEVDKFKVGKEYRVPMFLASSDDKRIPLRFLSLFQKPTATHVPVLFEISIDPADKCCQVNLLEAFTTCKNEREWLFAPYSTFRVDEHPPHPTPKIDSPVIIKIHAFPDNKCREENLALFPWH